MPLCVFGWIHPAFRGSPSSLQTVKPWMYLPCAIPSWKSWWRWEKEKREKEKREKERETCVPLHDGQTVTRRVDYLFCAGIGHGSAKVFAKETSESLQWEEVGKASPHGDRGGCQRRRTVFILKGMLESTTDTIFLVHFCYIATIHHTILPEHYQSINVALFAVHILAELDIILHSCFLPS